jgi:hypothetical protein
VRNLSRSDRALMRSAWADVARAPRALVGRRSETRSACFSAGMPGFCRRCERRISVGQDIRFHSDFAGYVHDGCRPPRATVRTAQPVVGSPRAARSVGAPQPPLCPSCHLEHVGPCW